MFQKHPAARDQDAKPARQPRRERTPPKIDAQSLQEAGLAYIAKFASSTARVRQVLMRRVRRHGADEEMTAAAAAQIDLLIGRWVASGLLNDAAFSETRAGALHRSGASARKIAAKLGTYGIGREIMEDALAEEEIDGVAPPRPGGDLQAAAAFARRRRLGPFRRPAEPSEAEDDQPDDLKRRQRELAVFARAGFSMAIATQILTATDIDAVQSLLRDL